MLLLMRKRIGKIVVKFFVFLLVLGFGAWGIQDMLGYQVGGGGAVAEVGDMRLGPNQFYREVNQEVARMRPLFGGRLDMEQAQKLGLVDMVLNRQLDSMATTVTANELGVAISDGLVRAEIQSEPMFKGLAGNFDAQRFRSLLNSSGLTEGSYVQNVRAELASRQLLGSVSAGIVAPRVWVNAIYKFREEKRNTDTVFVADKDSGSITEPTNSQLRAHFNTNEAAYTAPEYRAVTYVPLDAHEVAKEISIAEETLREAFDQRTDEFITEEKRKIRQMIVADESKAKSAHKRLTEGADFLVVAKEVAGQDASAVELGEVSKEDLLPELSGAVFDAAKGKVTEPAKTALGWHIFEINDITLGGSMSFAEAKVQLKKEMSREKAIDGLYELSNKFEDALGGGSSLEEAAGVLNLKVRKLVAIDRKGLDRAGKVVEALPGGQTFVALAFSTEETTESSMTEAGDSGFYILRVDKVMKPVLRPFEEVRAKVDDAWKAEQRRAQAETRAKAILDAVNGGKTLADVVTTQPLKPKASKPLMRDGRGGGADFDAALITDVFKLTVGKAAMGRVGDGYRIAVLKSTEVPDPAVDKKGTDELAKTLSRSLQGDISSQLRTAFRGAAGVTVYRQAIDALFGARNQ